MKKAGLRIQVLILLILSLFLAGCTQSTQYVCPDGRTVGNPSECQTQSTQQPYTQTALPSEGGYVPAPTVNTPVCGNAVPEEGETSANCCMDAGCSTGEACENNKCVLLSPEITSTFSQTDEHSATLLRSKTDLGLGSLTIQNTGNDGAKDVIITVSSPENYFTQKTETMPFLSRGSSTTLNVVLTFNEEILKITDKANVCANDYI